MDEPGAVQGRQLTCLLCLFLLVADIFIPLDTGFKFSVDQLPLLQRDPGAISSDLGVFPAQGCQLLLLAHRQPLVVIEFCAVIGEKHCRPDQETQGNVFQKFTLLALREYPIGDQQQAADHQGEKDNGSAEMLAPIFKDINRRGPSMSIFINSSWAGQIVGPVVFGRRMDKICSVKNIA